uniref:Reverse transcriptase domain-containing protein n=1 Tax=Naja naja TaxID=35670 RepID=A0A8C6XN85_NAJNA
MSSASKPGAIRKPPTQSVTTTTVLSPSAQRVLDEMLPKERPNPPKDLQALMLEMQDMMIKNHEDMKKEIGSVRTDLKEKIQKIDEKFELFQHEMKKNQEKIIEIETKVNMEEKRELELAVIHLEAEKAAHYLRLQNVKEDKGENLWMAISNIFADLLEMEKEELIKDIDELYRVQTNYLFKYLQLQKADIIALQETHISQKQKHLLENKKLGNLFSSLDQKKKRGVALYIKEKIPASLIYSDKEGRILMVEIEIREIKSLLVVIYAPNGPQESFFQKLHNKLKELQYQELSIIGHFNVVTDKLLDYKGNNINLEKKKKLPKTFLDLTKEFNINDVWRERNLDKKQFTYYSNRHMSWSRLDMMWMTKRLNSEIADIIIEPNALADHNMIRLRWEGKQQPRNGMLQRSILKEESFNKLLTSELELFFQENNPQDTSLQNNWDTAKAVMRGVSIKYMAKKSKEKKQQREKLQQEYKEWVDKLQATPQDKQIKLQLDLVNHKINLLDKDELAQKLKKTKQYQFENANKPGRWLASRLKKQHEKRWVTKLRNEQGKLCFKEDEKKCIIQKYYSDLYTETNHIAENQIQNYLKKIDFIEILDEDKEFLNQNITLQEVYGAIIKQKTEKAPGPDGLPAEIYKSQQEILGRELLKIFNEVLDKAKCPQSWQEARISIIPKAGADLTEPGNYRPISLLNVDYKIFMTIIAERFKRILNKFISADQNGFLPQRHLRNNIRVTLDILEYYEEHSADQAALLFLDAQKAFDNVKWEFILQQIKFLNLGPKFINVITSIYQKQEAQILINGGLTKRFPIQKGTRQGCPLSPLLFIMTLEALIRMVQQESDIKGLKIKKEEFKLQAFADDLLFILEEPQTSGLILLKKLEEFGLVAGLKINKDKTKMITKNMTDKQKESLATIMDIEIVEKIKYLGIIISSRFSSLKKDNYDPLIKRISEDLIRWNNLNLSFMGRIATVKMNILPKLLFLFQNAPIILNRTFFDKLNKIISSFIWQKRKPRIKLKLLQDATERGGLGLPNWELYHSAAIMTWLKDWINHTNTRVLTLEGHNLQSGWHAFLGQDNIKGYSYVSKHKLRQTLLHTWFKIKKQMYIQTPIWLSTLEALMHPHLLRYDKIITYEELLDVKGDLLTRQQLIDKGIDLEWWAYLQLQSKYAKDKRELGISTTRTELDEILLGQDKKMIKKIYHVLLEAKLEEEIVKETMVLWMRDFGYNINLDDWHNIWIRNKKITLATPYKENLYKLFYRWHMTPIRLAKINNKLSPICWKCNKEKGTYYHMWWRCRKAQEFWKQVHKWLQEMCKEEIQFTPEFFLLRITKRTYPKDTFYLMIHIITAARIAFAQNWKNIETPTEAETLRKIITCAEMDKLTMELKNKEEMDYYKIWNNFYGWLDRRKIQ